MGTRVMIDPNVRVRGNGTYSGFEDVDGQMIVGELVEVYEPESGLVGSGRITEIDVERELVFLSVDWASLKNQEQASIHFPLSLVRPREPRIRVLLAGCGTSRSFSGGQPGWRLVAHGRKLSVMPSLELRQPGVEQNKGLVVTGH